MDPHDRVDPNADPGRVVPSAEADETVPLHIQEATTPPVWADAPVAAPQPTIPERPVDPTRVMPVEPAARLGTVAPTYVPADPMYDERLYHQRRMIEDDRRRAWVLIAAVLALLVGGFAGFLIGAAYDDDEPAAIPADRSVPGSVPAGGSEVDATLEVLLNRTRADGEYRSPSEYPQLDEITEIDNAAATAALEDQVAMLTVAQEEAAGLTDQVAQLEQALADTTAERDELAAELAETGATDTDTQPQLDAANAQMQEAQAELAAANATIDELNVLALPNYVDGDVARARADAAANGWTLIEQSTQSDAAPGTVLEQAPAAASNMIDGSVLYITVAANI
jgi:uncharacterized tellurite resistance protein B-like protein